MKQKIIINLYVPINTILMCNDEWQQSLNLPKLNSNDLKIINELRKSSALPYVGGDIQDSREIVLDSNLCIRKVKSLSFYQYLLNRLLQEARDAAELGIRHFLIQNSNAPYFNKKEPVIYWLMRCLVSELKLICTEQFTIGLKLNGGLEDWALDIACRNKINYIISNDNIADLCLLRQSFNSNVKIYSDFNKQALSINQEGFVFEQDKEHLISFRNYLKSLPFYPKNINTPVILNVWDLICVPSNVSEIDYIICNSCFSKSEYCDCGFDKEVLNKFLELI